MTLHQPVSGCVTIKFILGGRTSFHGGPSLLWLLKSPLPTHFIGCVIFVKNHKSMTKHNNCAKTCQWSSYKYLRYTNYIWPTVIFPLSIMATDSLLSFTLTLNIYLNGDRVVEDDKLILAIYPPGPLVHKISILQRGWTFHWIQRIHVTFHWWDSLEICFYSLE